METKQRTYKIIKLVDGEETQVGTIKAGAEWEAIADALKAGLITEQDEAFVRWDYEADTAEPQNLVQELAARFSTHVREDLGDEWLAEVNRRNAADVARGMPEDGVCHSHDFIDPNQSLIDAMEEMGIGLDTQSQSQTDLINEAWHIAKASGFSLSLEVAQ